MCPLAGPTEITAFSDRHSEFKNIGAEVLGVSVDSQFTHLAWIQTDRKEGESLLCSSGLVTSMLRFDTVGWPAGLALRWCW